MWGGRIFHSQASIKQRLLIAVGLLTLATLTIGVTSWHWLLRSNEILEELHGTTIQQVNRSHELTRQSSVFTASAPFLLNLKSPYLVESEGSKLLKSIDSAIASWQVESPVLPEGSNQPQSILQQLTRMRVQILSLMTEVREISEQEDQSRLYTQQLAMIERDLVQNLGETQSANLREATRQAQIAANLLITATHETSFLSLGEYRRRFLALASDYQSHDGSESIDKLFADMETLALGDGALFSTRNQLLQHSVSARRALNGISSNANSLNTLLLNLIKQSETEIAHHREQTNANIDSALIMVAALGIGSILLALLSGFYISGYVAKNLNNVATAMTALARGDLNTRDLNSSELNDKDSKENFRMDEIAKLREAFKVFHSNASNLSRLNEQLTQKSALFESTFNNINDGIAITSAKGQVLAYNTRLNQLLGYFANASDVSIGCQLDKIVPDISEPTQEGLQTMNQSRGHLIEDHRELRNELGQIVEIRTSQLPDGGCVWLFSDTTQRRRVEERLSHFQRLESLGKLTGEVAHDFNNVLSVIKTVLPLAASNRLDSTAHANAIDRIDDAVDLGGSLTHRLLAFARKQRLDPKTIELNELVSGVTELIALSLGDKIDLIVTPAPAPVYVYIDPLQLESALLNLCMNSATAIDDIGEVKIAIARSSNNTVAVTVSDKGCGMSDEVLKHAIEPFYSTRRGGNGSGLGLSIVYGFLKQSGGDLHIDTEFENGTSVSLMLNTVVQADAPQNNSGPHNETLTETILAEKILAEKILAEKILVVEDDSETLRYAGNLLRSLGQQPIEVSNFDSAKSYLDRGLSFTTLFTDLHLGGVHTGWDLARYCIECKAARNIIVTSGKSNELALPPEDLADSIKLLVKPYTPENLQQVLES